MCFARFVLSKRSIRWNFYKNSGLIWTALENGRLLFVARTTNLSPRIHNARVSSLCNNILYITDVPRAESCQRMTKWLFYDWSRRLVRWDLSGYERNIFSQSEIQEDKMTQRHLRRYLREQRKNPSLMTRLSSIWYLKQYKSDIIRYRILKCGNSCIRVWNTIWERKLHSATQ